MRISDIILLTILGLLSLLIILPIVFIIRKIIRLLHFHIKYKRNKYIQTYKFENNLSPYLACRAILGTSGNKSIIDNYELPTINYIKNFNITSEYAEIYPYNSFNKNCCILYNTTHKNNYFKYLVTVESKKEWLYMKTYIFGKSKNCSFQDFQNKLSDITFLSISDLYKTSYSSEKEEELYFYKALNEHLKEFIPRVGNMKNVYK